MLLNVNTRKLARLIGIAVCLSAAAIVLIAAGLPDRAVINAVYPIQVGALPVAPETGALAVPLSTVDISSAETISLAAWRGSPILVNFWATWCVPCEAETPLLQAAYARYQPVGLKIIGLDVGEPPDEVLAWRARLGVTYNVAIDGNGRLMSLYRVRGLPTTFFIGRDGVIQQIQYGPLNAAGLDSAISSLLH